ncbi:ribonuclease H-like domain-containing protein [Phormidium sp. CCY1219]|uniref:ribonuclease H-like domain-containing protein n=1 Tax=Phormidium sp. CCY1219 TaxID=2886104 RepID=UPI002D1F8D49|nr:ribonuclease H-like domain-containing protein [Phormidium sp. CCY1219]MEB3829524.1 ribonuclease H-like domain-containing protein [Phormidium sp. CCY1219]
MFKKELWLPHDFTNHFYHGSIHNLVFLDLEFFPLYLKSQKVEQRIFGYTLTRLVEDPKQQYIKIQLIENIPEEKPLIQEIFQDIKILENKVFIGFNIIHSDLYCLHKRAKALKLKPTCQHPLVFDLYDPKQSRYRGGLNGLFEYLDINIDKQINGMYIRRNAKRVFAQKPRASDILNTIYEYCLEDAKNYFHIISNWHYKFERVNSERFIHFQFKSKKRRRRR